MHLCLYFTSRLPQNAANSRRVRQRVLEENEVHLRGELDVVVVELVVQHLFACV